MRVGGNVMTSFVELLKDQMQDPEFMQEWEALEQEFAFIQSDIDDHEQAEGSSPTGHPFPVNS